MPTADVAVFSRDALRFNPQAADDEPPLSRAVEVADRIYLGGLSENIAGPVIAATTFHRSPQREQSALYALTRLNPPGTRWDEDESISKVLFLSHLVHAHAGGFEHTARIVTDDHDRLVDIRLADIEPPFARAYCAAGATRRWLTQEDAAVLRDLVAAYDSVRPQLPGTRLGLAISTYTESPFVFHGRPRALLLSTTLEGLVSTIPDRAVKQFTTRVPPLASAVGLPFDSAWADRAYRLRSQLAHGSSVLGSVSDQEQRDRLHGFNQLLTEIDELLRRILSKALLESTFRTLIDEIDQHWPVPAKGCPRCRAKDSSLLSIECRMCRSTWV